MNKNIDEVLNDLEVWKVWKPSETLKRIMIEQYLKQKAKEQRNNENKTNYCENN